MTDDIESLYWKERMAKDSLVKVLERRLIGLANSYEQAESYLFMALLSKLCLVALIVLIAVGYFAGWEARDPVGIIAPGLICVIGIVSGFFAEREMKRCFYEIWWHADALKSTDFKFVGTYVSNGVIRRGIHILPVNSEGPELDFTQINWRSFIEHLY